MGADATTKNQLCITPAHLTEPNASHPTALEEHTEDALIPRDARVADLVHRVVDEDSTLPRRQQIVQVLRLLVSLARRVDAAQRDTVRGGELCNLRGVPAP